MRNIVAVLLLFISVSCSVQRPTGKTEAEVLYLEAQEFIKDKRYILATEKLNTLRSQFPYSYYATSAELLQADILFLQENYEEAASAYILFKDFHPKNNKMDYVMWKVAESYYRQKPETYDRDLSPAIKAIKYYNELKSLYPSSEYLGDANDKVKKCQEMLINKESYIADFYFRTEDFNSAKFRYINILKSVDNKELKSLAVSRVILIAGKDKDTELCRSIYTRYKTLIRKSDEKRTKEIYFSCLKK